MLEMYRGILDPKVSKNVNEVLHDLNAWEGQLEEYHRCGGGRLDERTRLLSAHSMIPHDTNPSIKLSVKKALTYEDFKRELRTTLNYLDSFNMARGPGAHMVGDQASAGQEQPAFGHEGGEEDDEAAAAEVAAMVATMQKLGFAGDSALAAARAIQKRNAQRQTTKRASTPPRDPKDIKCANCNRAGHTARECNQPKKALSERLCHICNKPGHQARRCPDRDKVKLAAASEPQQLAITDRPYRAMCVVEDNEGFQAVKRGRPRPSGTLISELPVWRRGVSQRERRANRYEALKDGRE